jgi:hypothetical protein
VIYNAIKNSNKELARFAGVDTLPKIIRAGRAGLLGAQVRVTGARR